MDRAGNNKKFYCTLGIILLVQLAAVLFFCGRKTGFHYDEFYSYYSSNVTYGLVPTDREWKAAEEIRSEFMVREGEKFRFAQVVRMQTYDVHPPLYYLLLHAVCSLTPDVFSKWQGLVLNLLFFVGSWLLLVGISWRLGGHRKEIAIGTGLLYGFNPAVISGVMLVRMYTLLGFWVLLTVWLHVKALEERKRGRGFYVSLAVTVYLGFLTHYYYAVYLFFLAAATELYLLLEKAEQKSWGQKWKDCIGYGIAVAGAMLLAVVSYPACLGHIFRGYRGTEAMGAFFDGSNTMGRIRFFAGLLNEYVFGSLLPLLVLALVLLALTARMLGRREQRAGKHRMGGAADQKAQKESFAERGRAVLIPAAATAGYFAVVTKTALLTAEEANRYQIPVYGLILMFFVIGLFKLAGRACAMTAARLVTGAMVAVLAAGELYGLAQNKVLFLYEEDAEHISFAGENHDVPVVYFYNPSLMWMIWDESLELMQYDKIYFVNMDDVSPLLDETLEKAERALVYIARGDNFAQALAAVRETMGGETEAEKLRELLYCDLYEVTAAAP